ncbi:TetR-like C-terminal domain-containing protein [Streptomyces tibetensis]|uniref:TetR-like C-terminal domain-containing protein n=1 Tax=Streptomyces tibetensis TaxID=2382123 RepID=UPI00381D99D8
MREELLATMTPALWSQNTSRVDLLTALHDTARQMPELCGLVRQRYVDSLHQAVEGVLAHAVERGDLPPRRADPSGAHTIAVSAAIALLLHWGLVRDRQVGDDDIAAIVDASSCPCSDGHAYSVTGRRLIRCVGAL